MKHCEEQNMGRVLLCFIVLYAAGCRHHTEDIPMRVEVPEAFSATGTASVPRHWWEAFGDASLNELIEQALQQNYDLLATWDRLAQAQAVAKKADATLGLWADLQGDVHRTRRESSAATTYSTAYAMGIAADYEVDLWSRLSSTRQAAWLDAEARREAVATAAITVAGSVADTWYMLAEAKALERIIQEQIETNQKVLELVTTQFRKGATSAADVLRQRQLVVATVAQKIAVEETIRLLQYRLSVLVGRPPAPFWQDQDISFSDLPSLPDVGVPTGVLWRRPDVRSAYRQVQAADQRLAAAVADQYPRLSIAASAETSGTSTRALFDDWVGNLVANAVQPLFDAGFRKAEVERQQALASEALHLWSRSVLLALEEVEDALMQEYQKRRMLDNVAEQLNLARRTSDQNKERYIKGQIDYIRVLESLQSLQSLERSMVSARRAVIQSRIALYRAIAGGWDMPQPTLEFAVVAEQPPAESGSSDRADKEHP